MAACSGNAETVIELVSHGCDVNVVAKVGLTPILALVGWRRDGVVLHAHPALCV